MSSLATIACSAVELHLDDLHQVRGFLGQRAEAVDQLGRECVDRRAVLELAEAAVEAHAQVEVGDIGLRDQDRRIDADLRREFFASAISPPALSSTIASSSIDW